MIEGDYYFNDELKYEFDNWDYCTEEKDRRFYYERQTGIEVNMLKKTKYSLGFDPKKYQSKLMPIPEGTYGINSFIILL